MKVLIASIAVLAAASLTAAQSPSAPESRPKDYPPPPPPMTQAEKDAYRAKLEKIVVAMNVPIEFYGRVMDSSGKPVAGLEVPCSVTEETMVPDQPLNKSVRHNFSVKTDANGKFKVDGKRGTLLGVGFANPYLQCAVQNPAFSYASGTDSHKPDAANPILFALVREEEAGPVQTRDMPFKFQWNGKPLRFDLATGKPSETGELEITPRRRSFEDWRRIDWCADVKLHGGAISPAGWRNAAVAPITGYQETVSYGTGYDDRSGLLQQIGSGPVCFLRDSQGKYSRLILSLVVDDRGQEARGRIELARSASGGTVIMDKVRMERQGK